MKTKFLSITIILIAVVIAIVFIAFGENKTSQNKSSDLLGQEIPILGRTHVPEGAKVSYNSNPPTSGNHWPQPAEWGIYLSPLPDEQLVHNLEHGGIWISYKDIDEEALTKLGGIVKKYPQAVIITSRLQNDTKIALASWGRLDKLDLFDEERIEKFIKANINNSPEKLASLEQIRVQVNVAFPDFSITEVDGRKITNESLKNKPVIIWFTTSWCVPCQIGAKEVSKLDKELGGNAFTVLVIFVDPNEKDEDLINWRRQFASEDWMVAFDNFRDESKLISTKVGLKFLDSKFLLDKNGVIQNIDFKIADDNYLNTVRRVVGEN